MLFPCGAVSEFWFPKIPVPKTLFPMLGGLLFPSMGDIILSDDKTSISPPFSGVRFFVARLGAFFIFNICNIVKLFSARNRNPSGGKRSENTGINCFLRKKVNFVVFHKAHHQSRCSSRYNHQPWLKEYTLVLSSP